MTLLVSSMKEYLKKFLPMEYSGPSWFANRVKEPSSWGAVALVLVVGAMFFQTYPVVWLAGAAACAVVAFSLKEKNVN